MSEQTKILVIKLGALGDYIQSMGPMAAIRKHHQGAHITLLTTKPFAKMGEDCGFFDAVQLDTRPKFHQPKAWLELRKWFQAQKFSRVYDLQNNDRTQMYLNLLRFTAADVPEWVGAAHGASHRNSSPSRTKGSAYAGHCETIALAGITDCPINRLEWMTADLSGYALKKPFVVLVAGSAPQHPHKRWAQDRFIAVAQHLVDNGYQPVLVGTRDEGVVTAAIAEAVPGCLDLTGQTSLYALAALGREAALAIGNDTGPMHLIGATGCPCVSLFCTLYSNPLKHAPLGEKVHVISRDRLDAISTADVIAAADAALSGKAAPAEKKSAAKAAAPKTSKPKTTKKSA
jgi:ADP-heptose:LPS heptosyltransferase